MSSRSGTRAGAREAHAFLVVCVVALALGLSAPGFAAGKGGGVKSEKSNSAHRDSDSSTKTSSESARASSSRNEVRTDRVPRSSPRVESGREGSTSLPKSVERPWKPAPQVRRGDSSESGSPPRAFSRPNSGLDNGGPTINSGPPRQLTPGPSASSGRTWCPAPVVHTHSEPGEDSGLVSVSSGTRGSSPAAWRPAPQVRSGSSLGSWGGPPRGSAPDSGGQLKRSFSGAGPTVGSAEVSSPRAKPEGRVWQPAPRFSGPPADPSRAWKTPQPRTGSDTEPTLDPIRPVPSRGRLSPAPGSEKLEQPPTEHRRPAGWEGRPLPREGEPEGARPWRPPKAGRVSFRTRPDGPPYPSYWRPRYYHYYYDVFPRYYIYGGWGVGWYDPWWWGNYWWPECTRTTEVHHYHHYDYDEPVRSASYYQAAPWMDAELQTALTDVAVAWTTGDIELLQAHFTPTVPVVLRHDWERGQEWVLVPPVLLDILLEALDMQVESHFRFAKIEQMEPGLVWAVAEHRFRLRDEQRERQATMEYMFRQYENAWLIEAIAGTPENYWWVGADILDDAARESARLMEEMDRARSQSTE